MSKALADFAAKHKRATPEITVKARTGRAFVLRELRGSEQLVSDNAGSSEPLAVIYRRIAGGLVSIDGDLIPDIDDAKDFQHVLDMLDSSELDDLLNAYQELIPRGEELKKEPGDGEPSESPTPPSPESPTLIPSA